MIFGILGVLGFAIALLVFLRSDPTAIAGILRVGFPLALGAGGLALLVLGQAAIGGLMLAGALGFWGWRRTRPRTPKRVRRSTVRTAALEMELDPRTGALSGLVLAGHFTDRVLAGLSLAELIELR
ncbi:MAG: molecular chaperone DnaJ, partial [Mesorhizobium amorphae]